MGLRIKTNVNSLMAQRQLDINSGKLGDSLEKLSSGYRINKSADDSSGLAITETMRAKISSLAQAKRNASDAISYTQMGEGSLNDMSNILIRMKELTQQATNDTLTENDRNNLDKEFQEIGKELFRIKNQTEFNGKFILNDKSENDVKVQLGIHSTGSLDDQDDEFNQVNLKYEGVADLNDSLSNLKDLNIQGETADDVAGGSVDDVFQAIDDSQEKINSMRAHFGAIQNRLSYTINSLDTANENLNAAQSRIKDVDYASETSQLTKSRLLVSAGTSVLAQANQMPEQVLALLKQ